MPTYEYRCENGHTVEAVQSFSDEPLAECPVCRARLRRVFHPVGIVLKGSGFYATDNRSGKRHAASSTKKDESKTDSSPAPSTSDSGSTAAPSSDKRKGSKGGSSAQAS